MLFGLYGFWESLNSLKNFMNLAFFLQYSKYIDLSNLALAAGSYRCG